MHLTSISIKRDTDTKQFKYWGQYMVGNKKLGTFFGIGQKQAKRALVAGAVLGPLGFAVISTAPALAASSFGDHQWSFVAGGSNLIDFGQDFSGIWDDGNVLNIDSQNQITLAASQRVNVNSALFVNGGKPLIVMGTAQVNQLN